MASVAARQTEEINRQTAAIRKVRLEMEAEARAWAQQKAEQEAREALQAEREQWGRDEYTAAEYDRWYLQTLLADSDADDLAVR